MVGACQKTWSDIAAAVTSCCVLCRPRCDWIGTDRLRQDRRVRASHPAGIVFLCISNGHVGLPHEQAIQNWAHLSAHCIILDPAAGLCRQLQMPLYPVARLSVLQLYGRTGIAVL